jgi:hypothetical protein
MLQGLYKQKCSPPLHICHLISWAKSEDGGQGEGEGGGEREKLSI